MTTKYLLYVGSFLYCTLPSFLYAYPYAFYRLIQEKDREIIKVVDLICDRHQNIEQKVSKPSRGIPITLLSSDERGIFTSVERTLLHTLREIAQKKETEPITLLWEGNRVLFAAAPSGVFMQDIEAKFVKEFAEDQRKNIIFAPADSYRFNSRAWTPLVYKEFMDPNDIEQISLGMIGLFIKDTFRQPPLRGEADKDLQKIQDPALKLKLTTIWNHYVENTLKPFYEKYIANDEDMTLNEFIRLPIYKEFNKDFNDKIIAVMTDYELLLKLFGSTKHVIIYAGGEHCDGVVNMLMDERNTYGLDEYKFQLVMRCGIVRAPGLYNATLLPDFCRLLKESPQLILSKYKAKGKYDHVIYNSTIGRFFDVMQQMRQLTFKEQQQMLNPILSEARAAYVDLINAQDASGHTALYYAVENQSFEMTKFLLNHGAIVNITDAPYGNTPLMEAVSSGDKSITMLLLNKGANPLQSNLSGTSVFDWARTEDMRKLLLPYIYKAMRKPRKN